jgi:RNA polymerase sigma-70 factor (ECF subfamily)
MIERRAADHSWGSPMTSDPPEAALCPQPAPVPATDAARVRALFDRNFAFIGRVVRNLGVWDADVDDLVQQAFSITAARLDEIPPACERSFLVQTAMRLAAGTRRARARAREVAGDALPEVPDAAPSAEELSDRRRARAMLDALLSEMDLDLRSVFVLYEIEELTVPEIAALLDLPTGTAASRLRRAREDFQARLRRLRAQPAGGGR